MLEIINFFFTADFLLFLTTLLLAFVAAKGLFPILRLAIIIIGLGTLLICSFPVGDFFLKLIEDHHRESPLQTEPYGIIVLGGAIDTNLSLARGKLVFNDSGERLYAGVKLAKKYASAHILLAGYESALSQRFFIEMGIDDSRLLIEDESSHTRENAKFSADLVGQGISQTWLLVTSAWHMPRAMQVFQKIGWSVIPYPVDFRSEPEFSFFSPLHQLACMRLIFRELGAILMYKIFGYA